MVVSFPLLFSLTAHLILGHFVFLRTNIVQCILYRSLDLICLLLQHLRFRLQLLDVLDDVDQGGIFVVLVRDIASIKNRLQLFDLGRDKETKMC